MRSDLTFIVNLLVRFSFESTQKHWNEIKHIFGYIRETINLDLFYSKDTTNFDLVGYVDAGYRFNPHKVHS